MRDYIQKSNNNYDKAIFIDRDGTINVDTVMPYKEEDFQLFDDTIDALKVLSKLNAYIFIITNQSGIALNRYSADDMHNFNKILLNTCSKNHIRINGIYYCPHYDKKHFPKGYTGCTCSKPMPGLLHEANNDFEFDMSKSILIGDKHTDIGAGINAGIGSTILVTTGIYKSGHYKKEKLANIYKPDYVAHDLLNGAHITKKILVE